MLMMGCKSGLALGAYGQWVVTEGFFVCHAYFDKEFFNLRSSRWTPDNHTCCQAFGSGTVTTCFNDLCLSRPGLKPRPSAYEANTLLNHCSSINVCLLQLLCLVSWQWRPMCFIVTWKQADLLTLNDSTTCMTYHLRSGSWMSVWYIYMPTRLLECAQKIGPKQIEREKLTDWQTYVFF